MRVSVKPSHQWWGPTEGKIRLLNKANNLRMPSWLFRNPKFIILASQRFSSWVVLDDGGFEKLAAVLVTDLQYCQCAGRKAKGSPAESCRKLSPRAESQEPKGRKPQP